MSSEIDHIKQTRRRKNLIVAIIAVCLFSILVTLSAVAYLAANQSQKNAENIDEVRKIVEKQTDIIIGQTDVIKQQNELLVCLLVAQGLGDGLKYNSETCKQRIQDSDNFDGTFARDDLVPQSTNNPSGSTVPNKNNETKPEPESAPGVIQRTFDGLGNLLNKI